MKIRFCQLWLLATTAWSIEPKTHVLYLGANAMVQWRGEERPLVAVRGDALVIEADGKPVPVSAQTRDLRIRLDPAVKLSRATATLTELQAERAYSAATHPDRQYETAAGLAQGAEAASDLALAEWRAIESAATQVTPGSGRQPGSVDPDYAASLARAEQVYSDSLQAQRSAPNAAGRPVSDGYDTFRLSFKVASSRPLSRPYLLAILRYRDEPGNAKSGRVQVYAQELPAVDATPRRVHLLRSGLPPGYELERYSLHLYEGTREIATTASAQRLELTTEEAFHYALVEHLAQLRSATQPPQPARDFWPAGLTARLQEENRNRFVWIGVDRVGRAAGVFHDEDGRLPVTDPDILEILPELRFLPALARGKAVPGVCRTNLGEQSL